MPLFPSSNAGNQQSAVSEWARKNGENPNLTWDDLNDAEKAEVQKIIDRYNAARRNEYKDPWDRKGNGNIPLGSLLIPCLRGGGGGGIIPNPRPVVPSVPTPDLPDPNDTSTNGGTNRIPFATNPTNVTIRTNSSSTNSNPGSTNRITNGNGRGGGINPRGGFTN